MKYIRWIQDNILFVVGLFLLAFIPLYPKIPAIGITHTFVYIRAEDFLVALAYILFLIQLLRKKAHLDSPLTTPIFVYWGVGLLASVLGVVFIFPHLQGVFPKLAFLFWLRHIEYLGLFFVAFAGIRHKKDIPIIIFVLVVTVAIVVLYAIGQRFVPHYFPAFSTMNEEFAKGIPLTLSALGRIQSTFAGHYDLAAYLVMTIPLLGSLVFGVKKWGVKVILLILAILSLMVLLMTASRTSFAMYLLAMIFMLIIQKQKKWILPVIIVSLVLLRSFTGIYSRYAATFAPVNVIVDARTGKTIGIANGSGDNLSITSVQSNGENLPQGSQYLKSSETIGKASNVKIQKGGSKSLEITNLKGDFIVQRAKALDISITTRLQAEWPNAIKALQRDLLFGSGYSSISLATDGNYFRILGETGLLGFASFLFIFLIYGIYVYRVLPLVDSRLARSLVLGTSAGIFGLALNAVLIDVFESSKVAYTLWLLMGFSVGILSLYQEKLKINYWQEVRSVLFSVPVVLSTISVSGILFFYQMLNNFFVADDFTWLRWISDCTRRAHDSARCLPFWTRVGEFFLQSKEFFYRPMEKVYFLFMYGNSPAGNSIGGLNPAFYHLVSLLAHILMSIGIFFLAQKLFKRKLFAFIAAMIFLVLAGHSEAIYWISASGHIFASLCILWGLLAYMRWQESKKIGFLISSGVLMFLAPLFQEVGVVGFLLVLLYSMFSETGKFNLRNGLNRLHLFAFGIPTLIYFGLKTISGSYWAAGDYRYNFIKLPFNAIGNFIGVLGVSLFGTPFMSLYDSLRNILKEQLVWAAVFGVIGLGLVYVLYLLFMKQKREDKYVLWVCLILTIIPFIPFAGLGNFAPRYDYLPSVGIVLFLVYLLRRFSDLIRPYMKELRTTSIVLLIAVIYFVIQASSLRASNADWQRAGTVTDNFVLSMNDAYENLYGIKHQIFYFANIPTKTGEAWIFPWGLSDAVWFDYKEKNPTVYIVPTVEDAKQKAGSNPSAVIFTFDKNNSVTQVTK